MAKQFSLSFKTKSDIFSLKDAPRSVHKCTPEYLQARKLRSKQRWQTIRKEVLYLSKGMCLYCYKSAAEDVHHIKPVHLFPELVYELNNLVPLCKRCHGFMEVRFNRGEDTETQIRKRMFKWQGIRTVDELAWG